MGGIDYRRYWDAGHTWEEYLGREVREHRGLWEAVWERARLPAWVREEAARIGGEWRLLVISEDWCGDASNTVPVIARLAAELPGFELRVVKRDENPELMDAHLTGGSRSIPVAIVLRPDFTAAGWWGPRPAELQDFVLREKRAGVRPTFEIYREARAWYARDRGESTVRELLDLVRGGPARAAA
jgi:thioredoxin family protein